MSDVSIKPPTRRFYADPFHPTRLEVLREIEHRNSEGMAARFSLGEVIREACQAVLDGDAVWETRRGWTGRWLTDQGKEKLRQTPISGNPEMASVSMQSSLPSEENMPVNPPNTTASGHFSLDNRGTPGHWDVSDGRARAFTIRGEPGSVVVNDEREDPSRPHPREVVRFKSAASALLWCAEELGYG